MTVANLSYRGRAYLKEINEQEQIHSHSIFQQTQTPPSTGLWFPVLQQEGQLAGDVEQFSTLTGNREPPYQRRPHHTAK